MASVDGIPLGTTPASTAHWGIIASKGDKGVAGNDGENFTPTAPITIAASGSITITVPGSVGGVVGSLVRLQGTNGFVTGTITSKSVSGANTTLVLAVTSSSGTGVLVDPVVTIGGNITNTTTGGGLVSTGTNMAVVGGGANGLPMGGVIWHKVYYDAAAGYVLVARLTGGIWGIWTTPDMVTFTAIPAWRSIYVEITFNSGVAYVHATSEKVAGLGYPGYHRTWKIVGGTLVAVAEVVDGDTTYGMRSTLDNDLAASASSYYTRVGSTVSEETAGVVRILGQHVPYGYAANNTGGVSSFVMSLTSDVVCLEPSFNRNTGTQAISTYSSHSSTMTDWDGYQDLYYPVGYVSGYRTYRGDDRRIGIAYRKGAAQTTVYYPSDDTNMHLSIAENASWLFYALWSEQTKLIWVRKVSKAAPIVAGVTHTNIGTIDLSAVPTSARLSVALAVGVNGLDVTVVRQGAVGFLEAPPRLALINYPNP
jgi:hypothetical protein